MKMRLYQINAERGNEQLAFIGLEKAKDRMDCASYDCVFDGEVSCSNLEEAFEKFNVDLPAGFVGIPCRYQMLWRLWLGQII